MIDESSHNKEGFQADTQRHLDASRDAMHVPKGYFETHASLLESTLKNEFEVPVDYFETQSSKLSGALQLESRNNTQRSIRLWAMPAAAAVFVGVLILVLPEKENSNSFAEQMEQTALEFEDLEYVEFDEEVYEEFIVLDTVKPDTVKAPAVIPSIQEFKPSKGHSVISWDDITADDIEEYLKDEETLEIIDEL